jgi:hypothetical protein
MSKLPVYKYVTDAALMEIEKWRGMIMLLVR